MDKLRQKSTLNFMWIQHQHKKALQQSKLWEEEKALTAAMEVGLCAVNYEDFFSHTTMHGKEYMGPDLAVPFEEKYENLSGDGPFALESRYITEDVPVGCYLSLPRQCQRLY